jgi:hypothetical protein
MRKNGKVWIPKHSVATICLPMSPAEQPTYIKEEKRKAPVNSAGRQNFPADVNWIPSWTSEKELAPATLPAQCWTDGS